jgi:hypothetical protein
MHTDGSGFKVGDFATREMRQSYFNSGDLSFTSLSS